MDNLARLVTVFDEEGAQQLINKLKQVEAGSKSAETATEQMTDATKKAATGVKMYSGALGENDAHVKAFLANQKAMKVANDNATKSTRALSAAGLNLSRQFSDVGVSLASGINPLMVLIQQGPQIADGFQVAAAAGLSFKAVLTGLWAQVTPLIAAFAPWIAGLAAVGAGVWYLVDAHKKHEERLDAVNKSIEEQRKALEASGPLIMGMKTGADLASEGLSNFDRWLKTSNISLAEQNRLLRENALQELNRRALKANDERIAAQSNVDTLEKENFGRSRGARVYRGKGSFLGGMNSKGYAEYEKKAYTAQENLRIATEKANSYAAMQATAGQSPTNAFADPVPKGRKDTAKEIAKAAAMRDGRYKSSGGKVIDLTSIATVGQENYTPGHLSKYKPPGSSGDPTINGDPMVDSADEASKKLQDTLDKRAKDRVASEKLMWDGLVALSSSGNKKLAAIGKAAAIAQATIDGINAVQKALSAFPPPFNIAAAALVGGLAAANVAKIAGVKGFRDGGWTGSGGVGQVAGVTHGQEFVVKAGPAAANRAELEAMNAGRAVPANPANSNSRGGSRRTTINNYSLGTGNLVTERVYSDFESRVARSQEDTLRMVPGVIAKHTKNKG